jgi:hypothetical protein
MCFRCEETVFGAFLNAVNTIACVFIVAGVKAKLPKHQFTR